LILPFILARRTRRRLICVNGVRFAPLIRKFDAAQQRQCPAVTFFFPTQEEETMPVDAMILSAAIVCVFVMFGSVLYWGERRTRAQASDGARLKRRAF
jgi:hypothetical protein